MPWVSLAVIVDTNTPDRVDDQRYSMAAHVLKIDHHPDLYPYADDNEVNDKAAAVCEILAEFMKSAKDKTVSKETAEYLYQGLLTDTLCFMTGNTTPSSLMAAAYLAQTGINIPEINRYLFDVSLKEYAFANFIRSGVKTIDNKLAYFIPITWHYYVSCCIDISKEFIFRNHCQAQIIKCTDFVPIT